MINICQVTKIIAGVPVLKNISIKVEQGEFVYLIGKSGAGKSSLLRLLSGEWALSEGNIQVADVCLEAMPLANLTRYRRKIGIIFQDFQLLPDRDVFANVAYRLEILGCPKQEIHERVNSVLELVGLSAYAATFPTELSGGEQQRVGIARAVITNPQLLLADEPTANLDDENSDKILQIFEKLHQTGTTVMMATHDLRLVNQFRHRIIELAASQLIRDEQSGCYYGEMPLNQKEE